MLTDFPKKKYFFYHGVMQDLKDHMRRAGEVTFTDVHKNAQGEG